MIPRLAFTPGEPAGIGPNLAVIAAQQARNFELVAFASPELLQARAQKLNLPLRLRSLDLSAPSRPSAAGELTCVPVPTMAPVTGGMLDKANAPYVLNSLDQAIQACLQQQCQALVTGPVQKSIINDAGIAFSGHTEYLAQKTGQDKVVMMLATKALKVSLVTTHLPIKSVAKAITSELLAETLRVLHRELQLKFGITDPRILVCGLNPHAGEGGHLGREELDTIIPALQRARSSGIRCIGPIPADTAFTPQNLEDADVVLAMYHDQGLPVLKYQGFGQATNITLGLPIIRTSVDHGTALDLVGTGDIDSGSLETAIDYALMMVAAKTANFQ